VKITLDTLRTLRACHEQAELFADTFPEGLDVSGEPDPATIDRIVSAQLEVDWLVQKVLTDVALAEYARVEGAAYAEYERVEGAALAEYQRVVAPARAEYQRVVAPAYAEYERVQGSARAEYQRVVAPAYAEYERVRATIAWRLLADDSNLDLHGEVFRRRA
jgi:hypothetical protein